MEDRPDGLDEERLPEILRAFGIDAEETDYARVGFGDYHWTVTGADGRRWFATVSDLENKEHCGSGARAALAGLRRAMETAAVLRERDGLDFVVAPVRSENGETVLPLDGRYALSVFPYVAGTPGAFGQEQTAEERAQVLGLLAELHGRTPPGATPEIPLDPPGRGRLEQELAGGAGEWRGGPYSEPARELLGGNTAALRARLRDFDRLAGQVRRSGAAPVVTHGEPHPGNLLRVDGGYLLVDWDTVGLAYPERDLAGVCADTAAFAPYTEATGRTPDPAALTLYHLRWDLAEVAEYIGWFQAPHTRTADTETAWRGFTETVEALVRGAV
ncbi:hypothetical protein GCM10023085_58600 [Actinomadura viridis]|uniref:Spectinomycin phosphotransferase n=1 Tax=Actinomadura viridis TaxID=58110 RepID=A0A931DT09_9ACTN|nr:phosphotransferase [Actinomadura viridis]MBG6093346.1 spectinomycin phosphotransferase [Actinomadura viridis]